MTTRHLTSSLGVLPAILFICSSFLACTVGPDYKSPDVKLPKTWQKNSPHTSDESLLELSSYWKMFEDQALSDLIGEAMSSNLTLKASYLKVEEALALYNIEWAQYFPDITLEGDLQRRRRSQAVSSAINNQTNDFLSLGGALSWELDLLGRVRRLNESAKANTDAYVEMLYGTTLTLQSEIAQAYVQLRTIQSQIALTKKNIAIQKESLHLAKERASAGVAPELDVHQAVSNLGQTEASLPLLHISLAETQHKLAVLLSKHPEELVESLSKSGDIPKVPNFSNAALPLDIIRQRPDLRQAERELASQHALIGAAKAELFPIVSLPGQFSFEALNSLENAFRKSSFAYTIGPSISWNIIDFKRRRNLVTVQDLRYQQLAKLYEQKVITAIKEVEDALAMLQHEKLRSISLDKSVKASLKSEKLVRSLYLNGLTDFQNVLDSERRLFEQELSLTQSEGNAVIACIKLFRALGGGWSQVYKDSNGQLTFASLERQK